MGRKGIESSTAGSELIIAAAVFSLLLILSPPVAGAAVALWIASVGARWGTQPKMEPIPIKVSESCPSKRRPRR